MESRIWEGVSGGKFRTYSFLALRGHWVPLALILALAARLIIRRPKRVVWIAEQA